MVVELSLASHQGVDNFLNKKVALEVYSLVDGSYNSKEFLQLEEILDKL